VQLFLWASRAIAPLICGAENDVPLHTANESRPNLASFRPLMWTGGSTPSTNVEMMPEPTHEQVTQCPKLENGARSGFPSSLAMSAPTPTTCGNAAGYILSCVPLLPALATMTTSG
jgi:hypothetical protein